MSLGMVLHGVRDYLRQQYSWDYTKCGVQKNNVPPANAGAFYIAIDDAGDESGPEDTDALTETVNLEIGVWKRTGGRTDDRLGTLKLPDDIYLASIYTNTDLERMVKIPDGASGHGGLHNNWRLVAFINTLFGLPSDTLGAGFTGQLTYRGSGRFEAITLPDNTAISFYGRRLRFRGLRRVQKSRATIG